MEPITRLATTSHFFLMIGYKMFSFFFPLYLVQQGFSLPQVGYVYFLIYLSVALFAPIAGWINSKIHPFILTLLGIAGYGAYSLVMLLQPSQMIFYLMQIALGVSAACFFVSLRTLLISANVTQPDRAFGYFYAVPNVAEALAPALGAVLIFFFDFKGVFIASLILHLANIFYIVLQHPVASPVRADSRPVPTLKAYVQFSRVVIRPTIFPVLLTSFSVLLIGGIYHPFFIIFLEHLGWSRNMILIYGAVFSALFVPVSYLIIRYALGSHSRRNVYGGSFMFALGSVVFGVLANRLDFIGVLALALVRGAGALVTNSGRSGHLSRAFPKLYEPAGVVDTMFSPLATALGTLTGGFLLHYLDFGSLFTQAGVLMAAITFLALFLNKHSA